MSAVEVSVGSKRSNGCDEYGEVSSFKKKRAHDDDGREKMRFLVAGRYCGAIIGKGGENIKRLRSENNCNIQVTDTRSEGVLTVSGDRDNCVAVFKEILPLIPESPYPVNSKEKCSFEVNLLVQSDRVGSVIGKGGQRIREIRDESNSIVRVYQDCLPGSNERVVAIGGEDESCVLAAFNIILKTLDDYPFRRETIYYDPKKSEGMNQNQAPPGGRDGGGDGAAVDRMIGMGANIPVNSNIAGGLGNLANLGGLSAADILGQLGLGGLSDAGLFGGGLVGMHGGNILEKDVGRCWEEERDHDNRGRRRDDSNHSHGEQVMNFADLETETKITVPNGMCGAIIGKRGRVICDIRQSSGAHIETSENEKGSKERGRVITITGTQRQIVIAQQMMAECLQRRI